MTERELIEYVMRVQGVLARASDELRKVGEAIAVADQALRCTEQVLREKSPK
jgi:hypothetical protein